MLRPGALVTPGRPTPIIGSAKQPMEGKMDSKEALGALAELKKAARTGAALIVIAEAVAMLRRKGLIDDADIERMFRKLEAHAAIISRTAPDASDGLADAVLQMRHALVEEAGKPN